MIIFFLNSFDLKMSSVNLLYIFKDPLHPTALGGEENQSNTFDHKVFNKLVNEYNVEEETFEKMLQLFPNIKENVVARYLDFFCHANKKDLSEAFIKLNEAIEYRSLCSTINYEMIKDVEDENFFYYKGTAKDQSSISYFTLENHSSNNRPSIKKYIHFLIYTIEKEAEKKGNYYSTLVIDRSKTTLQNQDLELVKEMFSHITLLYPGLTLNILLYPSSISTKILFTLLKSFLHENVIKLIKFIETEDDFDKYIDKKEIK